MALTPDQEKAAFAPHSIAITAGAGTGKTHLLAERYLYYLREEGLSPLNLVAATFTEKAAAELRSRIRSLVSQQMPHRSDILAELEAAQISTLHALAGRICREHPDLAEIPADFTILEELEGAIWLADCLQSALTTLPQHFYKIVPYSLMAAALDKLLNDPWVARQALQQGVQDWAKLAQNLRYEALSELLNHPIFQKAWETLNAYQGKAGDKLEVFRQVTVGAIADLQQGNAIEDALNSIANIKLNVGSQKNWSSATTLALVKETLKNLRELVEGALSQGLITLETGLTDEQLAQRIPILQQAYQKVTDVLRRLKQQARVLTFADLEFYALQALEHPSVREYYQQRWHVFLIDEFQDTNPTQAAFLEALCQNAQLTIVGDVKQSIYGFRRADVRVFEQFQQQIAQSVTLNQSFRSHQKLIEPINQIFSPLFANIRQNLRAFRSQSPSSYFPIQVFAVETDKTTNKAQRQRIEAFQIAQTLQELLAAKIPVFDKQSQQLRPIEPKDIAILTRTWEPLASYAEALAAVGIPVAPAGGGNLVETREAKDGLALLRFLAQTDDNIALVALLRSPFFALSDRILFKLGIARSQETIWWEVIQTASFKELEHPVCVLQQLLKYSQTEAPSRLLQLADRLTGYTAVIANLSGASRREADWQGFRQLVRQLEGNSQDVFGVVRRLQRLVEKAVAIARLPVETENAVALMTIFAAKGLEWPVVVVADLTRLRPNFSEPVYFDPGFGVALLGKDDGGKTQKSVLYRYLEKMRHCREEAEALRVLYVAMTRSRDYLILTAADECGEDLDRLRPGLEAAQIPILIIPFD